MAKIPFDKLMQRGVPPALAPPTGGAGIPPEMLAAGGGGGMPPPDMMGKLMAPSPKRSKPRAKAKPKRRGKKY